LTRRANQGHNATIAIIVKPARRNPPRAFSLGFSSLGFSNRTAAACHDAASPNARRLGVAGAPPSEPLQSRIVSIGKSLPDDACNWPARANAPARGVVSSTTTAGGPDRDKVLGLGTTDPLAGFASVTSNLVVSFYFAKRGFENVARIIKR